MRNAAIKNNTWLNILSALDRGRKTALHNLELKQLKYNKNPEKCKNCNKNISYKNKSNIYCSRSCSTYCSNRERHYESYLQATYHSHKVDYCRICMICGRERGRGSLRYCSTKCQAKHRWQNFVNEVNITGIVPKKITDSSARAKRYLIETRGHKCEICGFAKWLNKPIPLIMDHVDGNSYNNEVKNLRLVCGNCDMFLPTYKSKNKGNGRHYRRTRYAAGKSY